MFEPTNTDHGRDISFLPNKAKVFDQRASFNDLYASCDSPLHYHHAKKSRNNSSPFENLLLKRDGYKLYCKT